MRSGSYLYSAVLAACCPLSNNVTHLLVLIGTNRRCSERMVLPLWRSLHSLNLMLPKEDRKAMLLRLYNDDTPLMDHSKDRFNIQAPASRHENGESLEAKPDTEVNDDTILAKAEIDAKEEVKGEIDVAAEGKGGDLAPTGLGDREVEDGDSSVEESREDDIDPDATKEIEYEA